MHSCGSLLTQYNGCLCLYQQSDPLGGLCNIIRRWLNVECAERDSMFYCIYLHSDAIDTLKVPRRLRGAADLIALLIFAFKALVPKLELGI